MPKITSKRATEVTFAKLQKMDVYASSEAAELLGVDRSGICRYYNSGVLRCVSCGNRVYVFKEDVDNLRKLRRSQAKPTKRGGSSRKKYRRMKMNGLPRNA